MKFVVEKNALARMLRAMGTAKKSARGSLLRLAARKGGILFHLGDDEGGCEALVLEEGVCFFHAERFLAVVRAYAKKKTLTIEVTPEGIQIGNTKISRGLWEISLFQDPQTAPLRLNLLQPIPEKVMPEPEELPLWANRVEGGGAA